MPELPDVEIFRRYLVRTSLHQKIIDVSIKAPILLKNISSKNFKKTIKNNQFTKTYRHGKYLFLEMNNEKFLIVHFGMDGDVIYWHGHKEPAFTAILFSFANDHQLSYTTARKIGFISITDNIKKYIQGKKLGPDALKVSFAEFVKIIDKNTSSLKTWLMNQRKICGVGNIYADEILFQQKILPTRKINSLSQSEIRKFYNKIREVLKTAIKVHVNASKFPKNFLLTHRHKNGKCPICHTTLKTIKLGGRTTYFCPHCQT